MDTEDHSVAADYFFLIVLSLFPLVLSLILGLKGFALSVQVGRFRISVYVWKSLFKAVGNWNIQSSAGEFGVLYFFNQGHPMHFAAPRKLGKEIYTPQLFLGILIHFLNIFLS